MCLLEEYEAWEKGEVYLDRYKKTFVKVEDMTDEQKEDPRDFDLYSTSDWENIEYEGFLQKFKVMSSTLTKVFLYRSR
jgi:hypothetical protein